MASFRKTSRFSILPKQQQLIAVKVSSKNYTVQTVVNNHTITPSGHVWKRILDHLKSKL